MLCSCSAAYLPTVLCSLPSSFSCSCTIAYHPVFLLLLLINLLLLFHALFMALLLCCCLRSMVLCGLPCCFSCYCFMLVPVFSWCTHDVWCIPWARLLTTYNVVFILSVLLLAYNVLCCFICRWPSCFSFNQLTVVCCYCLVMCGMQLEVNSRNYSAFFTTGCTFSCCIRLDEWWTCRYFLLLLLHYVYVCSWM